MAPQRKARAKHFHSSVEGLSDEVLQIVPHLLQYYRKGRRREEGQRIGLVGLDACDLSAQLTQAIKRRLALLWNPVD